MLSVGWELWMLYLSVCNTAYKRIMLFQLLQCKTLFLPQLWPQQPRYEPKWLQYKICGVIWHCKPAILKKSSSNWLNTGKILTQVGLRFLHFRVTQGRAETVVRWGGKNRHSIAHSLSNISAKHYRNRLTCVEVTVCNVSVVFETRCRGFPYRIVAKRKSRWAPSEFIMSSYISNCSSPMVMARKAYH